MILLTESCLYSLVAFQLSPWLIRWDSYSLICQKNSAPSFQLFDHPPEISEIVSIKILQTVSVVWGRGQWGIKSKLSNGNRIDTHRLSCIISESGGYCKVIHGPCYLNDSEGCLFSCSSAPRPEFEPVAKLPEKLSFPDATQATFVYPVSSAFPQCQFLLKGSSGLPAQLPTLLNICIKSLLLIHQKYKLSQ